MNVFVLWFSRLIGLLALLLPRRVQYALGWFLGFLWWDIFCLRRFTIFRNLSIVFPDLPKKEKKRLARQSLTWMGIHFIDFLKIPVLTEGYLRQRTIFEGIENYENAHRQGKGVYFLCLHMGNGDLGAAMLSIAGFPVNLISKKFKLKWVNDFWFGVREMKGTKFIDPHGSRTPFEILKAIGKNEVVIFVLDQFMGKPFGIETTFFGRKTGTAYGLALFALKSGTPVLPVYTFTDVDGKTRIVFEPPIQPIESETRDLQIKEMTQKYNESLEQIILRHPEQWMWVHRRWKTWQ